MKHYTKCKVGDERDLLNPSSRRVHNRTPKHAEELVAKTKRRYTRRERAALKRMVDAMVVEELAGASAAEVAYLSAKVDAAEEEYDTLYQHAEWLYEIESFDSDWSFIVSACETARFKSEDAFDEWVNA